METHNVTLNKKTIVNYRFFYCHNPASKMRQPTKAGQLSIKKIAIDDFQTKQYKKREVDTR